MEDRFSWLNTKGVPSIPDWALVSKNQSQATEKVKKDDVTSEDQEKEYQDFLLQKLGKITFAQEDDKFTVDHEIKVCGKSVTIPVLSMEIDSQTDLIDDEFLKLLQMTPAERRARAQTKDAVKQQYKKVKAKGKKVAMKLATKTFSTQLISQLQNELKKKTRSEIFRKIKFQVRLKGKKQQKNKEKVIKKAASIKKVTDKIKAHIKATMEKKIEEDSKKVVEETSCDSVKMKPAKEVKHDASDKVAEKFEGEDEVADTVAKISLTPPSPPLTPTPPPRTLGARGVSLFWGVYYSVLGQS